MKRRRSLRLGLGILGLAALACGGTSRVQQTADAISAALYMTATAGGGAGPADSAATAQAEATANSLRVGLTQTAQSMSAEQASAAGTATAAPFGQELAQYGVDSARGRLAWVHPPIALDVEGYQVSDYVNYFIATVHQNFVVSTDLTWNTTTGLAGCGFVLRSNGDEESLDEYLLIASRGGNGTVNFIVQQDSAFSGENTVSLDAGSLDPNFQFQNDTTNRLAVVAEGNTFTIYTNGVQLGTITDNMYDRGFVAMAALSESGRTHCEFNNSWLWVLDE